MIVLIVEDDSSHNLILTKLVRRECKLESISCFSVAGARAVLESNSQVRAIVCDLQLSDGSAHEVFEILKQRNLKVPFLLYANDVPDVSAFAADHFLGVVPKNKPMEVCKRILSLVKP